jgi:hypothetical protein
MRSSRSLRKERHRIRKAVKALRLKYKILGYGKTRIVYDLENGYVLKVAISIRGLESNEIEFHLYNGYSAKIRKYLCPVIDSGDGWIIMQKMQQMLALTEEYEKKLPRIRRRFKKEGVIARSLRSKNLAVSNNRIIVIDYGSFRNVKGP